MAYVCLLDCLNHVNIMGYEFRVQTRDLRFTKRISRIMMKKLRTLPLDMTLFINNIYRKSAKYCIGYNYTKHAISQNGILYT